MRFGLALGAANDAEAAVFEFGAVQDRGLFCARMGANSLDCPDFIADLVDPSLGHLDLCASLFLFILETDYLFPDLFQTRTFRFNHGFFSLFLPWLESVIKLPQLTIIV